MITLGDALIHVRSHLDACIEGRPHVPVCLEGDAGIGKTAALRALKKEYDRKLGKNQFGFVTVNPAMMSDNAEFSGLPRNVQVETIVDGQKVTREVTQYDKPEWAIFEQPYGILFLDDYNRAHPWLLNATMQLIQEGRMLSWELPKGWMVVLSSNPYEGGKYNVNKTDEAQNTRMQTHKVTSDTALWSRWAYNEFDAIGVDFVLKYPEYFNLQLNDGKPHVAVRPWTNFLVAVENLQKSNYSITLKKSLFDQVADANSIPASVSSQFFTFLGSPFAKMPPVETLLKSFREDGGKTFEKTIRSLAGDYKGMTFNVKDFVLAFTMRAVAHYDSLLSAHKLADKNLAKTTAKELNAIFKNKLMLKDESNLDLFALQFNIPSDSDDYKVNEYFITECLYEQEAFMDFMVNM